MSAVPASLVFGKTSAGQAELSSRQHQLSLMGRRLLILVNGNRTQAMLAQLVAASTDVDHELATLQSKGLIETLSGKTAPVQVFAAGATPTAEPEKKGLLGRLFARTAGPRLDPVEHERMREACHLLQDMLGPQADDFLMRLESSRNVDELNGMLETASRMVDRVRGAADAQMFKAATGVT